MRLTLKEQERILIFGIAEISRRRWKRGLKLNYIEASSIICDEILERAREGKMTVKDLVEYGSQIVSLEDVMEGTEALLPTLQLEALFPDGTKLITVHNPIQLETKAETIKDLITL
jgi:urease gamma subunit